MNARSLVTLIAATDRSMLRGLSKCLSAFGHDVVQAATSELLTRALTPAPDFLVVDRVLAHELPSNWRESLGRNPRPYALCLVDPQDEDEVKWLIERGFDDLLRTPIVFGELLARLRVGARILEVESRVANQVGGESSTDLTPRARHVDAVGYILEQARAARQPVSCVLLDVDFLGRVNWRHGRDAGDAVLRAVAGVVREQCSDKAVACRWEADRFCIILPNRAEAEAAEWAERLRIAIKETVDAGDSSVTVSCGVAEWKGVADTCHELVLRALQATRAAKLQGRDQVVRHGDPDQASRGYLDLVVPSKLFSSTRAGDVMTPLAITVKAEDRMEHAAEVARSSRVPVLAVLDAAGKLAGELDEETLAQWEKAGAEKGKCVAEYQRPPATRFEETAGFQQLMDHFAGSNPTHAFIMSRGFPIGYVTRDSIVAMSYPIKGDTFAPRALQDTLSLDYLVVPDLVAAESR